MFLWDILKNLLSSFGFYQKSGKLLFIGLDDAGKTTLLNLLKTNRLIQPIPSQHSTTQELVLGNMIFTTFDVGGHIQVRKMWKDYFPAIDAIVFLIDASKTDRFKEAKTELDALLEEEQILNCPILILANKIDKLNAVSEDYMREYFNLKTTGKLKCTTNERPLEIFMSSLVCKQGYGDGFRWLSEYF